MGTGLRQCFCPCASLDRSSQPAIAHGNAQSFGGIHLSMSGMIQPIFLFEELHLRNFLFRMQLKLLPNLFLLCQPYLGLLKGRIVYDFCVCLLEAHLSPKFQQLIELSLGQLLLIFRIRQQLGKSGFITDKCAPASQRGQIICDSTGCCGQNAEFGIMVISQERRVWLTGPN